MDNMLKTIKYFNNFAVFCGNGAMALHTSRRGGAGAITGDANITAKLLSFIIPIIYNHRNITMSLSHDNIYPIFTHGYDEYNLFNIDHHHDYHYKFGVDENDESKLHELNELKTAPSSTARKKPSAHVGSVSFTSWG